MVNGVAITGVFGESKIMLGHTSECLTLAKQKKKKTTPKYFAK
jgi:hypothetical protein